MVKKPSQASVPLRKKVILKITHTIGINLEKKDTNVEQWSHLVLVNLFTQIKDEQNDKTKWKIWPEIGPGRKESGARI